MAITTKITFTIRGRPIPFRSYMAYGLCGIGFVCALYAPFFIAQTFIVASSLAACFGLLLYFTSRLRKKDLSISTAFRHQLSVTALKKFSTLSTVSVRPQGVSEMAPKKKSNSLIVPKQATALLFLGQSLLILFSFIFFCLLETQTRMTPRLQPLEMGKLFSIWQSHYLTLGFFPWALYGIVGVGITYLFAYKKEGPYLPRALFPQFKQEPKAFFYHFSALVLLIVGMLPFLVITLLALVFLSEGIQGYFGLKPMMSTPLISTMVIGILVLAFRSINLRLKSWVENHDLTVGKMLIIYVLLFSVGFIWLHEMGREFLEKYRLLALETMVRSRWVGSFSQDMLNNRLSLLLWSWWGIWLPLMSSLIARLSVGYGVRVAIFRACILPALFFLSMGLFNLGTTTWVVVSLSLLLPGVKLICAGLLFLFMWFVWGKIRTTTDIARGFMVQIGRWTKQPMSMWLKIFFMWITCFIPGFYSMGWVSLQVTMTLAAGLMLLVVWMLLAVLVREVLKENAVLLPQAV